MIRNWSTPSFKIPRIYWHDHHVMHLDPKPFLGPVSIPLTVNGLKFSTGKQLSHTFVPTPYPFSKQPRLLPVRHRSTSYCRMPWLTVDSNLCAWISAQSHHVRKCSFPSSARSTRPPDNASPKTQTKFGDCALSARTNEQTMLLPAVRPPDHRGASFNTLPTQRSTWTI